VQEGEGGGDGGRERERERIGNSTQFKKTSRIIKGTDR